MIGAVFCIARVADPCRQSRAATDAVHNLIAVVDHGQHDFRITPGNRLQRRGIEEGRGPGDLESIFRLQHKGDAVGVRPVRGGVGGIGVAVAKLLGK